MPIVVASAPDPYRLDLSTADTTFQDHSGKTQVSSVLPANPGVIITLGQSNMSCNAAGTFTPTNPNNLYQLSIYNGGIYRATNPLIGCSAGGTGFNNGPQLEMADALVGNLLYANVLLVPLANHVAAMSSWNGAVGRRRIFVALKRLEALGYTPTMFLLGNGEGDHFAGTSAASYTADCQALVTYIRGLGCTAPFFVNLQSIQDLGGGAVQSGTIRTGQANCVSAPLAIYQGSDWDVHDDVSERYDGVHFSQIGNTAAAISLALVLLNHF